MVNFTDQLESLNIINEITKELQQQPFIEVFERIDLGVKRQGNVPCKCGVYFIYRKPNASSNNQNNWELRYIGVHKSVRQRLSEHLFYEPTTKTKHKAYQIQKQNEFVYSVKFILIEPCSLREYIEHILIESLSPPDNIHS